MNKDKIHELREMAVHQGLFVEGVCDEGIRVTFFEPIYVNEIFLIKEDTKFCPVCGHLLLEFEEPFKHQYDYTHVCANMNCSYNGAKEDIIEFYDCDGDCCSCTCCPAEAESTLGLEYDFMDKVKDFFVKALDNLKDWAAR
jgi:hypothetical protein